MKSLKTFFSILLIATGMVLIAAACAGEPVEVPVTVEVTREVTVVVTQVVTQEVEVIVTPEPGPEVPYEANWASSAHAAADTEPFRHWDAEDPQEVPVECAKMSHPRWLSGLFGSRWFSLWGCRCRTRASRDGYHLRSLP